MIQIIRPTPRSGVSVLPRGNLLYEVDHGFVVLES